MIGYNDIISYKAVIEGDVSKVEEILDVFVAMNGPRLKGQMMIKMIYLVQFFLM